MAYSIGDKVTPKNETGVPQDTLGRVFTVAKVNPKNLKCTADDGGRGINFPAYLLLPATDENVAAPRAPRPFVPREVYATGEIVTLTRAWRDWTTETPLVVIADKGDKVNVTLLGGGADGQYLRVPKTSGLVKRDLAWLAETLIEAV